MSQRLQRVITFTQPTSLGSTPSLSRRRRPSAAPRGTGLESDAAIRSAAYSQRKEERRNRLARGRT